MVVNWVPVAPKSHALSEAAAECSTLPTFTWLYIHLYDGILKT